MKPWEQYQAGGTDSAEGPWNQFAAPTVENAIKSTPKLGVHDVPVAPQRSGSTRFRDAFVESALGIPRGIEQLAVQGMASPETQAAHQQETDARRAVYNEDIGTLPGFAGAVVGSTVSGGALLGALGKLPRIGKSMQAALLPTSAGRGAALGATAGGLQPVASDESRGLNTALGGAGGTAGYGMSKGLQSVLDRMTGGRISEHLNKQALTKAADRFEISLDDAGKPIGINRDWANAIKTETGIDVDQLPPDAKREVVEYIARAIAAGNKVSPEEAARQALVESLPVPITRLTRGQRSQNFAQQDTEGVLANTEAGSVIRNLRQSQRDALAANVDAVVNPLGEASTPQQLGQRLREDLITQRQAANAQVRELYKRAETEAGGKIVQPDELVGFFAANEGLEGISELLTRAKALKIVSVGKDGELIANKVPLAKLNDLRRSATVVGSGADGSKGYFAGQTKGVIDDIVSREGGGAYSPAIAARREMGAMFDNNQGVGGIISKKGGKFGQDFQLADEKIFDRLVKTGSINDLDNFLKVATPDSQQALRATLGNQLRETMVSDVNGQTTVSLLALEREMKRIGPEKLKRILGDQTVMQLNQVVKAASILERKSPDMAGGSQTAARLANLGAMGWNILDKAANVVPVVGPAVAGVVKRGMKDASEARQVSKALKPISKELNSALNNQSPTVTNLNAIMSLMGGAALPGYLNESPAQP